MLKHLVHSHHSKLHTFDDFYRNDSKPLKLRSTTNELSSSSSSSSSSPTATSSSPNNNYYTFYNVFSDFKPSTPTDVLPEEDETEENNEITPIESNPSTPVFYLEDEHQHHTPPPSSSSPHWPSSIISRLRHSSDHHNGITKQTSINDNHMNMTKSRKSDFIDSTINKHRFLRRSQTINHSSILTQKKIFQ
ncbi:unnamed protein product [Didymodactylos carnosus]|uniref:Uncharacterized protein n=2 Tax=Didymodactylos carnosus TaxID=1234261 RepID=A0A8S2TIG3_9BILA|nr:unnamed protein product [Didymodactylos carnosus]CAF4283876.1 unnamed protein product [Didymodactylos carnosus]